MDTLIVVTAGENDLLLISEDYDFERVPDHKTHIVDLKRA